MNKKLQCKIVKNKVRKIKIRANDIRKVSFTLSTELRSQPK